jgi:hypothetical protein
VRISGLEHLENGENEENVEDQGIDKIGDIRGTGIIQERTILDPDFHQARVEIRPCPPVSNLPFLDELELGGKRPIHWFEIEASTGDGFIEITEPYDIAMIFADGKLAADSFSTGEIWRIPADLLYGKHCILAMTDPNPNVYHEKEGNR